MPLKGKKYQVLYMTSFGHMMGGGQWSLYYLIKHLNKEIFFPIVVCPEEGELSDKMRAAGAEVICVDVGRIRYLNPFIIKRLIAIIKERQIALIHTDSTTETFYAGITARMTRVPLVWHIRVSDREWLLDKIFSSFSTRLILVAHALSRRFPWLEGSPKMLVIYNGIDLKEFDKVPFSSLREGFNISEDTVLLACIGRIEERKGQEDLIAAMRDIDNAKLIIVGKGDERYTMRLKELSELLGISERVIFADYRRNIPSLLKNIDILVFPSIKGEGFARVILEAMAAGKSVIATDDAGNPEAVTSGVSGYIVPAGDIPALVEKIRLLVHDKEKRNAMGQAGRKRVEEFFTIQQNVKSIQNVYLDIFSRHEER
jgi:glycosyltransferase involved in cell wall biosynthesis